MRKLVLTSLAFGLLGIVAGIISSVRWILLYPDKSNLILSLLVCSAVAVVGFGGAWVLSSLGNLYSKLEDLNADMASTQRQIGVIDSQMIDLKNETK